jgi:hypothetical protein
MSSASGLIRGGAYGLGIVLICGSLVAGAELVGAGSWDGVLLGLIVVAALVGLVGAAQAPFARTRPRAMKAIAFSVVVIAGSIAFSRITWEARSLAFGRLANRSEPLVRAIKQYESTHGRPPSALSELVPSLLTEAPSTGMAAYPAFEYEVFPPDVARRLYWFDLGNRDGKAFDGLWKYVDGDEGHAIFVVETSGAGTIVKADVDRMPPHVTARDFDQALWRNRSERMRMVADLVKRLDPVGKPFDAISNTLGSPDGSRTLLNAKWELRVPCSNGMLNWDVFFYWPSEDYPDHAYGGSIERIGKWAYVHE